jgi:uncharacterized protein with beta-barrel porin domain
MTERTANSHHPTYTVHAIPVQLHSTFVSLDYLQQSIRNHIVATAAAVGHQPAAAPTEAPAQAAAGPAGSLRHFLTAAAAETAGEQLEGTLHPAAAAAAAAAVHAAVAAACDCLVCCSQTHS